MNSINRKVVYSATQKEFFNDVLLNKVASKMRENQNSFSNQKVSNSEYRSWENSPKAIKLLMELSELKDTYVTFEYQVPYSQRRIDCMLYGKNYESKGTVVHIELKQWDKVVASDIEGNFVETYTGVPNNIVAHPSLQVRGYHNYLTGFVQVFEENVLGLYGCAYCHNYEKIGEVGLYDPLYKKILDEYPVYGKNQVSELSQKLKTLLSNGDGFSIFNKFMQSPVRPSKKLLESASKIVKNSSDFTLLNDQIVARNTILSKIRSARSKGEKSVILIKGGPGTGKTVIALHILAEIASARNRRNVFFSTKSKPLLEGIKNRLERGSQAKLLFTNLNQFIPSRADANSVDVLIVDEAHRIAKTPNHQYTKTIDRTDLPQIETLIRASKVSIFFIDNKQAIRSAEIGSTFLIREYANKYNCTIEEVELISQFRCNGSDNYLDWIESVFGYTQERKILKAEDNFDFQIISSPQKLYNILLDKEKESNVTARLVAGFCWQWSKKLDENGNLVKDVEIGDFAMPWETHSNITRVPKGYVKWYEWAYKPEGIKQVGCIYTAQGFEFDYIGVIVGNDIVYDSVNDCLIGNIEGTQDPTLKRSKANFDEYVRNIYRVLMTRGMKGCYVYFVNREVENYFRKRIK